MAWYRTGTITVTNGSTTVTGSGTVWIANAAIGEALYAPDGRLYEITNIASDTSLTLGSAYLGATSSAQAYTFVPSQSYIRDLAAQAADLVNNYSTIYNTVGQGKFSDGTLGAPGIRFANDLDTGFYRSASNEVTFVAGGTAIFKYNLTGGLSLTAGGDLVGTTATQTLTNKTLGSGTAITAGTINGTTIGATTPSTVVATQVDITAQGDLRLQDTTGGQYVALQAPGTIATSYTLTLPVDDGTSGQALITDGSGVLSWSSAASGDVYGPASATDNAVARYDGTTGKIIQNSAVTIADTTGDMTGVGTLTLSSTIGVKTTASAEYNILVGGNLTGGVNSGGLRLQSQIQSDVTSNARGIMSIPSTAAAAFTISNLEHFFAGQGSLGAGSAVTSQYGYRAASSLTGATNNYGFYGDIPSGTNRWNFYAAGTADNYFAGKVGIGTSSPGNKLNVVGGRTDLAANSETYALGVRYNSGAGIYYIGATNSATPDLVFSQVGGVEKMRLTSLGRLGIGTTAPEGSLVVSNSGAAGLEFFTNYPGGGVGTYIQSFNRSGGAYVDTAYDASRHAFLTSGTERMRIASTGTISLGAAPGAESLRVTPVASAVNYVEVRGNAVGFGPEVRSTGSDTNVSMSFLTKGSGSYTFYTNNSLPQFVVAHTASAVNYLQVTGNVTGATPYLSAHGSDANINLGFLAKGTGNYDFWTGSFNRQFAIAHTASAVNWVQVTGGATGGPPVITAQGSDTNISLYVKAKGTGFVVSQSNTATYFQNLSGATQFIVGSVASSVNYINAAGGATGNAPGLYAQGSDTNVDLALVPQGTGVLKFGTYTAGVVTQAGYITIKDAGGTTRRLLVG